MKNTTTSHQQSKKPSGTPSNSRSQQYLNNAATTMQLQSLANSSLFSNPMLAKQVQDQILHDQELTTRLNSHSINVQNPNQPNNTPSFFIKEETLEELLAIGLEKERLAEKLLAEKLEADKRAKTKEKKELVSVTFKIGRYKETPADSMKGKFTWK